MTITSYNEWQEGTQIEPARVAVGKPGYDGAWGRAASPRSARTSPRRRAGRRASRRSFASVERRREPAAVRRRSRVLVSELVEDRERELAKPVALARAARPGSASRIRSSARSWSSASSAARTSGSSPLSRRSSTTPSRAAERELVEERATARETEHRRTRRRRGRPERLDGRDALDAVHRGEPGLASTSTLASSTAPSRAPISSSSTGQGAARAAPRGPEVDDDGTLARALDDVVLEGRLGDVHQRRL